jgi:hypothetical protein
MRGCERLRQGSLLAGDCEVESRPVKAAGTHGRGIRSGGDVRPAMRGERRGKIFLKRGQLHCALT